MYRHRDFEMVTVAANYPDEKNAVLNFLKSIDPGKESLLWRHG